MSSLPLSSASVFLIGHIIKAGPVTVKERLTFHSLGVVFPSIFGWLRTKKHVSPIATEGMLQSRGTPELRFDHHEKTEQRDEASQVFDTIFDGNSLYLHQIIRCLFV